MQKLLKEYNCNLYADYYDIILISVINGQRKQAKEQFKAMPVNHRKQFVKNLCQNSNTDYSNLCMFIDLI